MEVEHGGSEPTSIGPEQWFTGTVRVAPLFTGADPSRMSCACVSFDPSARSAWHTHPCGQTLVVTAGGGFVQAWGGPIREIKPGDVIWTPPGQKHRHGAARDRAMTPLFAALDPDPAGALDGVREARNMPLQGEPARVRDGLHAFGKVITASRGT
jgi:quercetin dioxygenase-like cupin family protein